MAKKDPIQYKGFTINYLRGEYRADAYASPQFTNTNLAKLKKEINQYLRDESKVGSMAKGGEIPYSKEIYDQNGVLIKVGDRLKGDWKSTRGSGKLYNVIEGVVINSKNYPVPAVGIMLNNGEKDYLKPEYDYSQSRFVLKGRSNDMNIGIEVVGSTYAKGGEIKKYIIVRGTKESEKYYYQKGSNEHNYKWLSSKKGATIFTDIKEAEKYADESDGDIVSLTTYAEGGTINIPIEVQLQAKAMGISYPITADGNAEIDVKEIDRYIDKSYAEGGEIYSGGVNILKNLIDRDLIKDKNGDHYYEAEDAITDNDEKASFYALKNLWDNSLIKDESGDHFKEVTEYVGKARRHPVSTYAEGGKIKSTKISQGHYKISLPNGKETYIMYDPTRKLWNEVDKDYRATGMVEETKWQILENISANQDTYAEGGEVLYDPIEDDEENRRWVIELEFKDDSKDYSNTIYRNPLIKKEQDDPSYKKVWELVKWAENQDDLIYGQVNFKFKAPYGTQTSTYWHNGGKPKYSKGGVVKKGYFKGFLSFLNY